MATGAGGDLDSALVGVAGEYLVAAELSMRGFLASITLRNSRGIDILASDSNATRSVSIQVKASSGKGRKWILNQKSESYVSDSHFYIFVVLPELGGRPDFYVVPSKIVADRVARDHREWLGGKKADGTARKDSAMRNYRDPEPQFREAWDLLRK